MKGQRPERGLDQHNRLSSAGLVSYGTDWLLEPIGFNCFVKEFWDQSPLYIEGRGANYYSDFFTLTDFDSALNENSIRSPFLRLVRDGVGIPLGGLSGDGYERANLLEEVFAQHREGVSIVLQFLHEMNGCLKDLSRDLSVALSAYVQVNAYLTPMCEHGLGKHYDTHDVFVMQIHGNKYWTLYDRSDLVPYKNERGRRSELKNAKPTQSITLSPGDCLYIPRGWVHQAESREISSLHLTVGVHPIRWGQVFQGAVMDILRRDRRFRCALPPGFATCEHQRQATQDGLRELWSVLTQAIDPGDLLDEAVSAARRSIPPCLDGHLLDLNNLDQIDLNTQLRVRSGVGLSIEDENSVVRVMFHGKVMECPAALNESMRFVTRRESFRVSELPDMLTDTDKLVLVRRLVKEGLLTFEDKVVSGADPPNQMVSI